MSAGYTKDRPHNSTNRILSYIGYRLGRQVSFSSVKANRLQTQLHVVEQISSQATDFHIYVVDTASS